MSWMVTMKDVYDSLITHDNKGAGLEPYYHKKEQCHIEITIDERGNFLRAKSLLFKVSYGAQKYWKGEHTIIPVTPKSLSGRTSGPAPYPLAEQLQYIAKDYSKYGGKKKSYFGEYLTLLETWAQDEDFSQFKVRAVYKYIVKGTVVRDLVKEGLLYVHENNGKQCLINSWGKQGPKVPDKNTIQPKPSLFLAISSGEQGNAKVRWRVQKVGQLNDTTWDDDELIDCWQRFQERENIENGFCQISGERCYIASTHPKGVNPKVNDAKIVSTPTDGTYLTFRGRFTDATQPCGISFEISQKAHNTLRWLIENQGYSTGNQVFVSWAVSSKETPNPLKSSYELFNLDFKDFLKVNDVEKVQGIDHSIDFGEYFAHQLNDFLSGYQRREKIEPNDQIIVMGLDSATKGRAGIVYYRKLLASEFFDRLKNWYIQFSWYQRYTKEIVEERSDKNHKKVIWPISSPPPRAIAEAAYGDSLKSNETLKKSVVERIIPCIIDGQAFPRDLLTSAVRRASNRNNCEPWEWQRNLGVACALYRGYYMRHPHKNKRREYRMSLEPERTTRDYLYGRLLAIAERIEETALHAAEENRPTNAARLMQRFADRPFSTWRTIELGLQPYMQRLQAGKWAGFLVNRKKELDSIYASFQTVDFSNDKPLSGEFLLGYHCQKQTWFKKDEEHTEEKGE